MLLADANVIIIQHNVKIRPSSAVLLELQNNIITQTAWPVKDFS